MNHPYFLKQGMYQSTFLTKYTACMIYFFLLISFFFPLSHARGMLINSISHLFHRAYNLPSLILSSHSTTATLLILAVCRTRFKYEPII